MQHSPQAARKNSDILLQIAHYLRLFWRAKWYLLISAPVGFGVAIFVLLKVMAGDPELPATALIGIENTAQMTAVPDIQGLGQGRADLIRSRNFLHGIVTKLSLRFRLVGEAREDILDSVLVDSAAIEGTYLFSIDKLDRNSYTLYYQDPRATSLPVIGKFMARENRVVDRGRVADLALLRANGVRLRLSDRFLKAPKDFSFHVVNMRVAIELLYRSILIKDVDPRRGTYNIAVSVSGKDYRLITETVNAIADAFVERNLEYARSRSQSVLAALEKQLESTRAEFDVTQRALRDFRTANPTVGLTMDAQQAVESISSLETSIFSQKSGVEEAKALQSRFNSAPDDERTRIAEEMVVFLMARRLTAAPVLQRELADAAATYRTLLANYNPDHPLVRDQAMKLQKVRQDVAGTLGGYIADAGSDISRSSDNIRALSGRLQRLPSKELELAELQRKQQVASDLFAAVFARYNQAKAADVVNVSDVYVMDYALRPIPPPSNLLKILGMAVAIALAISFGPVVLIDYFDPTARTEFDARRKTHLPILECVPAYVRLKSKADVRIAEPGKLTSKKTHFLIAEEEVRPAYVGEIFRSLATKVQLKYHNYGSKTLAITSMESSVGKSTIAANLAASLAKQGVRVLLIDADMRCGVQHTIFNKPRGPGLCDLLSAGKSIGATDEARFIQTTGIPGLHLLTAGSETPDPAQYLGLKLFQEFVETLSRRFDLCVFDTPPLGPVSDAVIVGAQCSGIVFCALSGKTKINHITKKILEFPELTPKVIGLVLNRAIIEGKSTYYDTSRYYVQAAEKKSAGAESTPATVRLSLETKS